MKKIIPFLFLLAACNSKQEKILIFSKGNITVNGTNVSIEDDNNYTEKEIDLSGDDKKTLSIKSVNGNYTVDIPSSGFYVLNARKDTVVGSYQRIGKDLNGPEVTIEELGLKIDSLQKLIIDLNVSPANKNFFITSNQLQKITDNTDAIIVGPFQLIPASFDVKNGQTPEVYKFYTTGEMRDMIVKLKQVGK